MFGNACERRARKGDSIGTWGANLFEDDTALDARGAFEEALGSGLSAALAADRVLRQLADPAQDDDDRLVVRLALASLLLDHGVRRHAVLDEARRIVESGQGLERWEEAGDDALAARRAVYERLQARLS